LELLLENLVLDNTRHNQEFKIQAEILNDSLDKLSPKVDSILHLQQMLETQICQVAQQVTSTSQPSGVFPSQTETNPKGLISAITLRDGKQLEDPIVKVKNNEGEIGSNKPQSEKAIGDNEKPLVSAPYKSKIPFPQGFDEFKLDEQFRKFIEIIQDKLPPKDLGSFSMPCVIGSEIIERAICDLGENVSLMSLSLSERLGIG
jgi:hypothetical protein